MKKQHLNAIHEVILKNAYIDELCLSLIKMINLFYRSKKGQLLQNNKLEH